MRKHLKSYILLLLLIIPLNIEASTLTSYTDTVIKANNYITSFNDRRKYLIFNKNYVYEKTGFGDSRDFTNGGLLSKSEFDLSIVSNQSYLATGKEYWTLTSNGSNKYFIDAYLQSKAPSNLSGSRITQYVKPNIIVNGKGTYSNPWTFSEGYSVDIISNNTSYGTVNPSVPQYVVPNSSLRYTLVPSNGYYYNGNKDECELAKVGTNKYENNYLIENINEDITCTAVFELQTYKFNLQINDEAKDYKNVKKTYTSNPSPNPIYYKYKINWYSDALTTTVTNKITMPTVTGWTFNGYYYGSTKVIDSVGNIKVKDLNLGTTNDFKDIEHTLYANITKNNYAINYNLNGGSYGTNHPTSSKYDEVVNISNPTRAGYSFAGWSFNGNSSTAKTGSTSSDVNTTFTANTTKTLNQYFANLTPTNNGTVTLTANWSACPAGTYNDGTKTTCTPCSAGSYTLTTGNTTCKTCEDGYYCGGGTDHNGCPLGKEGTGTGKTSETNGCSDCTTGKYSDTTGLTSCKTCPDGYTSNTGATAQNQCYINVSAGKYIATSKTKTQTECSNGYYKTAHTVNYGSTSSCTQCPAEYRDGTNISNKTSESVCLNNIAPGHKVASARAAESECEKGYYSIAHSVTYGSTSSCDSCPNGYKDGTLLVNKTSINQCLNNVTAGYKVATAGAAETKCAAGTAKGAHGVTYGNTSSCSTCEANKYSYEGAGSCTNCPGSMTSPSGSASITSCSITCSAGNYLAANSGSCSTCTANNYCSGGSFNFNESNNQGINACPSGYTSSEGSNKCSQYNSCLTTKNTCQGGYEQVQSDCATGSNTCQPGKICPAGYKTGASGSYCGYKYENPCPNYYTADKTCSASTYNQTITCTCDNACKTALNITNPGKPTIQVNCQRTAKTCKYCPGGEQQSNCATGSNTCQPGFVNGNWNNCLTGSPNACQGGYRYYPE